MFFAFITITTFISIITFTVVIDIINDNLFSIITNFTIITVFKGFIKTGIKITNWSIAIMVGCSIFIVNKLTFDSITHC